MPSSWSLNNVKAFHRKGPIKIELQHAIFLNSKVEHADSLKEFGCTLIGGFRHFEQKPFKVRDAFRWFSGCATNTRAQ